MGQFNFNKDLNKIMDKLDKMLKKADKSEAQVLAQLGHQITRVATQRSAYLFRIAGMPEPQESGPVADMEKFVEHYKKMSAAGLVVGEPDNAAPQKKLQVWDLAKIAEHNEQQNRERQSQEVQEFARYDDPIDFEPEEISVLDLPENQSYRKE